MSKRVKATVVKPLVTGSVAIFDPNAPTQKSYKWTVYVKGLQNEDLSQFISKVVFTLHSSFMNPIREVTRPPFLINEVGWGEFEIGIQIHFIAESEKPIDLNHFVRLFPTDGTKSGEKPVVNECYDEIVFTNPKPEFYDLLMAPPRLLELPKEMTFGTPFNKQKEQSEIQRIYDMEKKFKDMIDDLEKKKSELMRKV